MKGKEIRRKFIEYFKKLDHKEVPSLSLIPPDDPTLLFTNAGMVQFKKIFLGEEHPPYKRAVSCQKCMRAGGKHNDLENVGYTARHHTFFEMLGNFSFGDYFKKEAIAFAWEFVTKELHLPKEHLYVTVYKHDEEAVELWKKIAGFSEDRIIKLDEKDNFWVMGDTGPCGPCSEIIFDQGPEFSCKKPNCKPGCDCDRYLEIWNLVFMQYERDKNGKLTPLPKKCIDTGMGLERITAVLQGVPSNYDTDLFLGIMKKIEEISGKSYKEEENITIAFRVIADHIRASTFLIAEGIIPSNEGRGYVLRRIIRRAQRFGKLLGIEKPFLYKLVEPVIEEFGSIYNEIVKEKENIQKIIKLEEEKFLQTLSQGLEVLAKEIKALQDKKLKVIPGEVLFKLYDTYGFPYDLVRDYALPLGFQLDLQKFEELRKISREKSKKTWKVIEVEVPEKVKELAQQGIQTKFVGYEVLNCKAKIIASFEEKGNFYIITDKTPFYPEGGGQVPDKGIIKINNKQETSVLDVKKIGEVIYHKVQNLEGFKDGEEVELIVDKAHRKQVERHHTATHLLHSALRKILGSHVKQSGSLVASDRLRFDFTHFQSLSEEEIKQIENLVNFWILENYKVETFWTTKEEAEKLSALAFFKEKYGEKVRVVKIDDISIELCGGTHVKATGEIGIFKILNQSSVASGVRRITAICGEKAREHFTIIEKRLQNIADSLKCSVDEIENKVKSLVERINNLENQIKRLKKGDFKKELEKELEKAEEIKGIKLLVTMFDTQNMAELREIGDYFKQKLAPCIIFLLGKRKEGALAVCMVTKDIAQKYPANKIFDALKPLGLKGGGKEELCQGSFTKDVSLEDIKNTIKKVFL